MSRILVVDDEKDVVYVVRRILEDIGHKVLGAGSGGECLEILKKDKPDLILLDIMMPGLDGWQTLELIRRQEGLLNIPVAMLTAKSLTPETAAREDIKELFDYIEKPFSKESLIKKVNYSIIEDLEKISEKKARLRLEVNEKTASDYEIAARLERLHKSILVTLKESLDKTEYFDEREGIRKAVEFHQRSIEAFRNKRDEMEGRLNETSTPRV